MSREKLQRVLEFEILLGYTYNNVLHKRPSVSITYGFTLVELLVVISIISLLSSVILSPINTARIKARNGLRVALSHQLDLALRLYYDARGDYPAGEDDTGINWGIDYSYEGQFIPILRQEGFLPADITDPINNDQHFFLYIWSNGGIENRNFLSLNCGAVPPANAVILIVPEGGAIKGMAVSPASPNTNVICMY